MSLLTAISDPFEVIPPDDQEPTPEPDDSFCIQKIEFKQQELELDILDKSDAELILKSDAELILLSKCKSPRTAMELVKKYAIKAGDTFPPIIVQVLGNNGEPLDLTGYSATFIISEEVGARPIVNRTGTVLADGKLQFDWLPGETDNPGEYLLEIILKKGTEQFTLPGAGYAEVIITPRLWENP